MQYSSDHLAAHRRPGRIKFALVAGTLALGSAGLGLAGVGAAFAQTRPATTHHVATLRTPASGERPDTSLRSAADRSVSPDPSTAPKGAAALDR